MDEEAQSGALQQSAGQHATAPSTPRPRRTRSFALCLLGACLLGAGLWTASRPHGPTGTPRVDRPVAPSRPPDRGPTNRAAATKRAAELLALLRLPHGDHLSTTAPSRVPREMRGAPDQEPGTPYLVDLTRYWATRMTQSATLAWLTSTRPTGSSIVGSGTWGGPGVTFDSLEFSWPASGVLALEEVQVSVASVGAGSVVRFDAQVAFHPQRPRTEEIPQGVVRIVVRASGTSRGATTTTVTAARQIAEIETLIAAMRGSIVTSQPGGPCLGLHSMTEHYRLSFYTAGRAAPVAVVSGTPWTVGVDNVDMTVNGNPQRGLLDTGLKLGHAVATLTASSWPSPYCSVSPYVEHPRKPVGTVPPRAPERF